MPEITTDELDTVENWISVRNDEFMKLYQRVELWDKYINRIKVKIATLKDKEFRLL